MRTLIPGQTRLACIRCGDTDQWLTPGQYDALERAGFCPPCLHGEWVSAVSDIAHAVADLARLAEQGCEVLTDTQHAQLTALLDALAVR